MAASPVSAPLAPAQARMASLCPPASLRAAAAVLVVRADAGGPPTLRRIADNLDALASEITPEKENPDE